MQALILVALVAAPFHQGVSWSQSVKQVKRVYTFSKLCDWQDPVNGQYVCLIEDQKGQDITTDVAGEENTFTFVEGKLVGLQIEQTVSAETSLEAVKWWLATFGPTEDFHSGEGYFGVEGDGKVFATWKRWGYEITLAAEGKITVDVVVTFTKNPEAKPPKKILEPRCLLKPHQIPNRIKKWNYRKAFRAACAPYFYSSEAVEWVLPTTPEEDVVSETGKAKLYYATSVGTRVFRIAIEYDGDSTVEIEGTFADFGKSRGATKRTVRALKSRGLGFFSKADEFGSAMFEKFRKRYTAFTNVLRLGPNFSVVMFSYYDHR